MTPDSWFLIGNFAPYEYIRAYAVANHKQWGISAMTYTTILVKKYHELIQITRMGDHPFAFPDDFPAVTIKLRVPGNIGPQVAIYAANNWQNFDRTEQFESPRSMEIFLNTVYFAGIASIPAYPLDSVDPSLLPTWHWRGTDMPRFTTAMTLHDMLQWSDQFGVEGPTDLGVDDIAAFYINL